VELHGPDLAADQTVQHKGDRVGGKVPRVANDANNLKRSSALKC
jgi:hypothetical protein